MVLPAELKPQTWQRMKMVMPSGYQILSDTRVTFATKDIGWLQTTGREPSSNILVSWLFKTTDGGDSWSYQSNTVSSIFVLDSNHIWMRSGNYLLVTKNGGQSLDSLECLIPFDKWYFSDQNHGIAIATVFNKQWFTVDGGKSWNIGDTTMYFGSITDIDFPTDTHGWVVGDKPPFGADYGMIAWTTDGGQTWGYQALFPPIFSPPLTSVDFFDTLVGFAGGPGNLLRTKNGGMNWEKLTLPTTGKDVSFLSSVIGFTTSWLEGDIYLTKDMGENWEISKTGADARFEFLMSIRNDGHVFAFGQNGAQEFVLIRSDVNRITGIERQHNSSPDGFEVIDAYPNPFQEDVTVSFTCTANVSITVRVHSILGIEITRDILEYAVSGTHYWNWFPKKHYQHAAGLYVLTMQTRNSYRSKLLTFLR